MTTNTTPSTASQAPEVLAKQVAAWRAEVVRLNDLIAYATGGSQAPAVSIDTPEFRQRLRALRSIAMQETMDIELNEICDDIDARLAQANAAAEDFRHMAFLAANASRKAEARATAAEAKLEAIRQGVDGLKRYFPGCFEAEDLPKEGQFESPMWGYINGEWLKRDDVLALLRPQPQADESGLPG